MNQHPDFDLEKQHLENTITDMRQIIKELYSDIDSRSQRMHASTLAGEAISAYVHAMLRSDNAVKIQDMENALANPYFGRVDFREDDTPQFENFYIGRCKVARTEVRDTGDILVFDWRDPVSTIFYETQGGRASYEVLGRYRYSGDVRLKRQFKIEDGVLKAIVDNYVLDRILENQKEAQLADPLLTERLRQGAADKLRDIVTSIQAEQNRIIREPLNQVTIIQGVAGSGKSTIGLHRLSYLLYNEKLNPDKLIVIAPNRIFLDYIAELLPNIDAADVRQMVWEDLAQSLTGPLPPLLKDRKPDLAPDGQDKDMARLLEDTARLKSSLDFIQVLSSHIERKLQKFCRKLNDLVLFDGQLIIALQEQLDIVMSDVNAPYNLRLRSLERYITFRVNNHVEVLEARARRGEIPESSYKERRREADGFLKKHFRSWQQADTVTAYREALSDKAAFKTVKDKNHDLEAIIKYSLDILAGGHVEREDLAPLAYLSLLLEGWQQTGRYDHIVIDEAQDLSAFEFFILKKLSANGSFTIMGDLSQGIHYFRGISSWDVLLKEVFGDARAVYREVVYSYRSAKEIVDVCNRVMPQGHAKAIPVYEIGRKPTAEKILSAQQGAVRAVAMLKSFLEQGAHSVGIITKRESEACEIYPWLREAAKEAGIAIPLHLVSGEQSSYQGHVSVLPVHLAKGLEFDGVIVWNASEAEFSLSPLDARLLYVALSRAMHSLHIMYQDVLTPLLRKRR